MTTKQHKPSKPETGWAAIERTSGYVFIFTIQVTRRDSKAEYLRGLPERVHKDKLKRVRFAKVLITEVTK